MKFWTGFVLGAAVVGLVGASMDPDRRERLVRTAKNAASSGRSGEIAASVSDGVGGIADVATDRVTTAVETATTKVAESIDAN
jgi:hypothetical protein